MFSFVRNRVIRLLSGAGFVAAMSLAFTPALALELSALTEALPPLNYELDGKVVGFSSDLLDLMAKEAELTVVKRVLPWARAYDMVGRQPNTLIYSLARTPSGKPCSTGLAPSARGAFFCTGSMTAPTFHSNHSMTHARTESALCVNQLRLRGSSSLGSRSMGRRTT